jgi:hypothetical protein
VNTSAISLTTDKATYRASDPVKLTIVNTTASTYHYNPCTRILEREASGAWSEVREERMCTMIAHVLDARATRTEETDLGDAPAAGRYRIVLLFSTDAPGAQSQPIRAVSAPITVRN